MDTFEVRDYRNRSMFRVDDEYLNGYSKLCGTNATLVYLCLCRHADRKQESFPSVKMMAEKTGVSRDSIIRGIKKLIEWNIIAKERGRRKDATWLNNRYILLDKTIWKPKPSSSQPLGISKSQIEPIQVANEGFIQVAHSDTKVTHNTEGNTYKEYTSSATPTDNSFDVFWDLYPRKVEKKKALQKWNKLKPETKKIILEDLPKRKMQSQWMKGFVPHPTTYLNGERWNDELEDSQITEIPTFKGYKIN